VSTAPSTSGTSRPDAAVDPSTLPQTRDEPTASSAALQTRVGDLWAAIVSDDPDRAMSFFFPSGAYVQVKAIENPIADWRGRLVAAYVRDIHLLHHRLRRQAGDSTTITFDGFDVPHERARWVEPGEEYNKIGYYRVFGSRLRYRVGDETRTIEIKSLISWRGEWYVVHLHAIE
jgi:hypothetical protein